MYKSLFIIILAVYSVTNVFSTCQYEAQNAIDVISVLQNDAFVQDILRISITLDELNSIKSKIFEACDEFNNEIIEMQTLPITSSCFEVLDFILFHGNSEELKSLHDLSKIIKMLINLYPIFKAKCLDPFHLGENPKVKDNSKNVNTDSSIHTPLIY